MAVRRFVLVHCPPSSRYDFHYEGLDHRRYVILLVSKTSIRAEKNSSQRRLPPTATPWTHARSSPSSLATATRVPWSRRRTTRSPLPGGSGCSSSMARPRPTPLGSVSAVTPQSWATGLTSPTSHSLESRNSVLFLTLTRPPVLSNRLSWSVFGVSHRRSFSWDFSLSISSFGSHSSSTQKKTFALIGLGLI